MVFAHGMKSDVAEGLPISALTAELDNLQQVFRGALDNYVLRVEAEIAALREAVEAQATAKKLSGSRMRDMRDMLTVLRSASIKPGKGRRKDLKKIDSILGDLAMLTENW